MRNLKSMLLAATIVAGVAANPAFADTAVPLGTVVTVGANTDASTHTFTTSFVDTTLHGAGASSISNIIVRNFNCIGTLGGADIKLGKSSNSTSTIAPGNFQGDPGLDCSDLANKIQPHVAGQYVSTGSGFGRQMWKEFTDDFQGGAGANAVTGVINPFDAGHTWGHLHFAISDSGLSKAELDSYNTNAKPSTGAAITFPLYVLPIAVAYASSYGINAKGQAMVFNAQGKGINGTSVLNLTKAAYCGIFNGTILNWNDPALQLINGVNKVSVRHGTGATAKTNMENLGVPLYDPTNDTATRWAADGAPIRLVGRLDGSGTTNVFSRHLAAVCNATNGFTGTNKFLTASDYLPFSDSGSGNADFTVVRSDTKYKPNSSGYAGTTNSVSGDYFDGTTIQSLAGTHPSSLPTGTNGSGLFLIADGGGKVASAIVAIGTGNDYPSPSATSVKLNGKIGYISADFIQPSVDAPGGLVAAALQVGNGAFPTITYGDGTGGTVLNAYKRVDATYALPTVKAALTGFTQAPPSVGDSRQVTLPDGTTGAASPANPLAWQGVLYATSGNADGPLSNPQKAGSYPMVGTTQFFGYTCYSTSQLREALVNHLAITLGLINKNSTGGSINKGTIGGTVPSYPGVDVQSNIGIVPTAWATAISNTFLTKNGTGAAANLYIQDALAPVYNGNVTLVPAIAADRLATPKVVGVPAVKGLGVKTPTNANPDCGVLAADIVGTGTALAPQFPAHATARTGA